MPPPRRFDKTRKVLEWNPLEGKLNDLTQDKILGGGARFVGTALTYAGVGAFGRGVGVLTDRAGDYIKQFHLPWNLAPDLNAHTDALAEVQRTFYELPVVPLWDQFNQMATAQEFDKIALLILGGAAVALTGTVARGIGRRYTSERRNNAGTYTP
mgnify:CR=1 FL=1